MGFRATFGMAFGENQMKSEFSVICLVFKDDRTISGHLYLTMVAFNILCFFLTFSVIFLNDEFIFPSIVKTEPNNAIMSKHILILVR